MPTIRTGPSGSSHQAVSPSQWSLGDIMSPPQESATPYTALRVGTVYCTIGLRGQRHRKQHRVFPGLQLRQEADLSVASPLPAAGGWLEGQPLGMGNAFSEHKGSRP